MIAETPPALAAWSFNFDLPQSFVETQDTTRFAVWSFNFSLSFSQSH